MLNTGVRRNHAVACAIARHVKRGRPRFSLIESVNPGIGVGSET